MNKYDILKDDIYLLIRKIAIPASIGSVFTTLYNVVDTIFAGQVGEAGAGLAGVSITFPLFLLVLSLSIGLGAGTSALVGTAIGGKNRGEARCITYNSLFISTILTIGLTIILFPLLPGILRFMKVSEEVLPYSLAYIKTLYIGSLTFTIPGIANSVMTAQGITKPYRNILVAGFFLNVILDPLFLGKNPLFFMGIFLNKIVGFISFGSINLTFNIVENLPWMPNLGTMGIALATVIIQFLQGIYMLYMLYNSPLFHCKKSWSEVSITLERIKEILKQGVPATINMVTVTTGIFILNYFVSYIGGKDATAALGIGYRVEQIIMIGVSGVYVAMLSIISQNRGAGNLDRVYETFKKGALLSFSILFIGAIFIYLFRIQFTNIFVSDPTIVALTSEYLSIESITIPAYAILSSSVNTLQAIKKPKISMYVTFLRQFILPLILYSLVTFVFKLPLKYIWISVLINVWGSAIILLIAARRELKSLKTSNQ